MVGEVHKGQNWISLIWRPSHSSVNPPNYPQHPEITRFQLITEYWYPCPTEGKKCRKTVGSQRLTFPHAWMLKMHRIIYMYAWSTTHDTVFVLNVSWKKRQLMHSRTICAFLPHQQWNVSTATSSAEGMSKLNGTPHSTDMLQCVFMNIVIEKRTRSFMHAMACYAHTWWMTTGGFYTSYRQKHCFKPIHVYTFYKYYYPYWNPS